MNASRNKTLNDSLASALGHHQAGRLQEAEALYRKILDADPKHPDALHYLGVLALQEGRSEEARRLIGQSLDIAPVNADALNNIAQAFEALGRADDAIDAYRRAIAVAPGFVQAHVNLGDLLAGRGDFAAASEAYEAALKVEKDDPYLLNNLGNLRQAVGDLVAALKAFDRAVWVAPDFVEAHYNRGLALQELEQVDDAAEAYERALAIESGYIPALVNLGLANLDRGRDDDALAYLRRAIERDPENAHAHFNLGLVLADMGCLDDAIGSFRRAVAVDPGLVEAHYNLALSLLKQGVLGEGWDVYDCRFQSGEREKLGARDFPQPLWRGEDLAGKSLLVWAEQGVGDEILFSGMVPDLLAAGANVTLECDARLAPLFKRSFAGVDYIEKKNPPAAEALNPGFDFQVPSGSLARHLRRDFDSFNGTGPYLVADADKTQALREKYEGKDKLLIGLAWISRYKHKGFDKREGLNKSMTLNDLSPLEAFSEVTFVDLQYGDTVAERTRFADQTGVSVVHDDDIDQMTDLDTFAAQVAAMDLVLSISNTTVHMAGALGVPCWVLLNTLPLHTWMRDRDDSPWYPSIRLFRQQRGGDWAGVVEQVLPELGHFVARPRRK